MDLDAILRSVFGFESFREGQREAIETLLRGERVLLIQPTGWGKSLVYQMLAYIRGLTLVFSPLRALMRDQVRQANERFGIKADTVNSDMDRETQKEVLERAARNELQLLFIAPERLDNELWQEYVPRLPFQAVVVDEAHCISMWGHDFRPDYRRIVRLIQKLPEKVALLAVTATVTPQVERDIAEQLGKPLRIFRGSLARPNLALHVQPVSGDREKALWLLHLVKSLPGTGLVYSATRERAEFFSEFLQKSGIVAPYYHAKLGEERMKYEAMLLRNEVKALVCTNAFGMGVDKPDIRFVIHTEFPASPLHYYHEMGRAGRDGELATVVLLFDPEDRRIQEYFVETSRPPRECYEKVLQELRLFPRRESDLLQITGYARSQLRTILNDLLDQELVVRDQERYYRARGVGTIDLARYETIRMEKIRGLETMLEYAEGGECRMVYLCRYLGDMACVPCGICDVCSGRKLPAPPQTLQKYWESFDFHPVLHVRVKYGKAPVFEAGIALDYYSGTPVGEALQKSKYSTKEPLPDWIVQQSAELLKRKFPLDRILGIIPVPSTEGRDLVSDFAQRLAKYLGKEYLPLVEKVKETRPQKDLTNRTQKTANLKGAFSIPLHGRILCSSVYRGKAFLVVDDICDSGITLGEIGKLLKKHGIQELYAFCIAKTRHQGDL